MVEKVIIFDFDGTLADTTSSIVRILNRLFDRFGYENIDLNKLRQSDSKEVQDKLGLSAIKIYFVTRKVRSELNKEIESLKPIKNLRKTLLKLKEKKYKLGILTSNSKENVNKYLNINDLSIFDFVHSEGSIFNKSKALKKLLKDRQIDPEDAFYVGDETRDIKAAKKVGIKVISVSWGFNFKEILNKQNPDFLIDKPEELITIL